MKHTAEQRIAETVQYLRHAAAFAHQFSTDPEHSELTAAYFAREILALNIIDRLTGAFPKDDTHHE
jgi:hypothetical protein